MQSKNADIHSGHRQRLKSRFLSEGLDRFELHNVLELLLFFGIPRRDTNPIAHELLNRFGSFSGAFDAPVEELMKISGMTESAAVLMKLVPAVARRYELDKQDHSIELKSPEIISEFLRPYFTGKANEELYMLCLDTACRFIVCHRISEGSPNAAQVNIRKIMELVIASHCANIVIAHNHPFGMALPSQSDICTTDRIYKALKACGVNLLDHIILSPNGYSSMFRDGHYRPGNADF